MRHAVLALAAVLLAGPASAQVAPHSDGTTCTLYDEGGVAVPGPALDPAAIEASDAAARRAAPVLLVTRGRAATFEVQYSGFTAEARAAYQAAVNIWADHLESSVPIRVNASFTELGERVLGSAGPGITINFAGAPRVDTWYPFALADAITGRNVNLPTVDDAKWDITSRFSSNLDTNGDGVTEWYFGLDGNTPADKYDFLTVVLHELGHGLGFVGSARYDDGAAPRECDGTLGHGCYGYETSNPAFPDFMFTYPIIFDAFVEDGDDVPLLDTDTYPQNSEAIGALLVSNGDSPFLNAKNAFIDGPTIRAISDGPAPIYAPDPPQRGSSYSHWDEYVYRDNSDALMTPQVGRGESYQDPGTLTCAFFADMGWPTGPGCTALFGTPAEAGPLAVPPALMLEGPNPFRARTRLRLTGDVSGSARPATLALVDALGRTVRALTVGSDGAVEVDGAGLAPGVYVVRVEGTGAAVPLVLAR